MLVGKGAFTKCYLNPDGKTVTLKSRCYVKECMSLGWFPESRLFPKIKRINYMEYEMEYYPKVRSLKNNLTAYDYKLYQVLRNRFLHTNNAFSFKQPIDYVRSIFETIPNEFDKERTDLLLAVDGLSNYGCNINFEISPRNVAVKDNQLILLDIFYFWG